MEPLAWYIAGPLIGITVPTLLLLREKQLGVSSSFRVYGSFLLPGVKYFGYDRGKDLWQVWFTTGILLSSAVIFETTNLGVPNIDPAGYGAADPYQLSFIPVFFTGSLLIGFGARYANGCTAGHCIMGNAQFALSSLITTICFFIGGLLATYFIVPQLFET